MGGTTTNLVAQRAVVGQNLDLAAATTALNSGAKVANLRAELVLPQAAGNDFQGLSKHDHVHLRRHPAHRRLPLMPG